MNPISVPSQFLPRKRYGRTPITLAKLWGVVGVIVIILLAVGVYFFNSGQLKLKVLNNFASVTQQQAPLPIEIKIPKISVDAPVVKLGLNSDQTIQIPSDPSAVGWYQYGAAPGAIGPAVMVGHLDWWTTSRAVFYNLHLLKPGDAILVKRQDGSTVTFKVDKVQSFSQDNFPTQLVYGPTTDSELRLVTCGGKFDFLTQHYSQNLIVFASLVSS